MGELSEDSNLTIAELLSSDAGHLSLNYSMNSSVRKVPEPSEKADKSLQTDLQFPSFNPSPLYSTPVKPPTTPSTHLDISSSRPKLPRGDLDLTSDSFILPVSDLLDYAESSLASDVYGEATLRSLQNTSLRGEEGAVPTSWQTTLISPNKTRTPCWKIHPTPAGKKSKGILSKSQSERLGLIKKPDKSDLKPNRSLKIAPNRQIYSRPASAVVSESPKGDVGKRAGSTQPLPRAGKGILKNKKGEEGGKGLRGSVSTTMLSPKLVTVNLMGFSGPERGVYHLTPSFLSLQPDMPTPAPLPHPRPFLDTSPPPDVSPPPSKPFNLVSRYRRTKDQLPDHSDDPWSKPLTPHHSLLLSTPKSKENDVVRLGQSVSIRLKSRGKTAERRG